MSCSQILNDYDGVRHDYTRKQGLVWQQVFLPEHAPQEWQDRGVLWNAVEENEKTKDSRLAREFVVALPIELKQSEWQELLTEFIQDQFVADGMCADVCIHDTDGHNPHAHIMLTVRPLDEQLVLWREAWTDTVNRSLERSGMEERIDHRSHAARGLDEQPTVHEGVIAQALERKGIVSDRCELNRQIKADNALLRELKAQVNKLLQAIKNTIPALAEAIESLREKMIVFRYHVRHILSGKEHIEKNLKILQPELTRYIRIAEQIKEKSNERKTLLAEKKAAPIIQILKHRELSRRIAELTEDLEELRSEKALILQSLQYTEDTGVDVIRKDISTMEAGLKRLEQQEQKYTAELDNALKEYAELKEQAAEFDADELMSERLDIRPGKERSAASRVQSAYGDRYQPLMMYDAKRDVSQMMGEEMEARSIRERLHRKQQPKTQQQKNPKHHEQER